MLNIIVVNSSDVVVDAEGTPNMTRFFFSKYAMNDDKQSRLAGRVSQVHYARPCRAAEHLPWATTPPKRLLSKLCSGVGPSGTSGGGIPISLNACV